MSLNAARLTRIAATMALLCVSAATSHAICGDVSGDGQVRAADALRVLRASVGQSVNLVCDECPELSVVRGTVGARAETIEGEGFTATYVPAGSGGVEVGAAVATNGSDVIFTTAAIPPLGTYLLIKGTYSEIYRISEIIDASHFRIDDGAGYRGGASASEGVTMFRGTTLYPGYTIIFATPFQGRPSVTLATEAPSVQGLGQGFFVDTITLDSSAGGVEASGTAFHVYLLQTDIPRGRMSPHIPGAANTRWNFIAVGTK